MTIVILGARGFPNVQCGVERYCENLSARLVKLGCRVIVLTRAPYVDRNIREFAGVKLVALPALKTTGLEAFFHTFIGVFVALRYRPDILHIQAIGPAIFTPLAKLLGMKVVITTQGSNYEHAKWGKFAKMVLRAGEYLGMKFADEVICVTKYIADEMEKKYGRKCRVIPNGVPVREASVSREALKRYSLERGRYILTVGRFVPEKCFPDLIDAFQKSGLKDRKLVIVGGADYRCKYSDDLIKKAEAADGVVLTGLLSGEPLYELYSHAGLFVLPSYYEGLPMVLLEAMSFGLLCLASDIPANRSVSLPDDNYFPARDIERLCAKLKEFIDRRLSAEERSRQIAKMREKYDWRTIAKETVEVYKKVSGKE